ncbi:GNAT family N-acetyltransferase [Thermoflavimicrobium dichotomicum]|uniref:Ribosomal protein S18 acetylase RimI n=1 Tax=Thermoflavimicrobium dichotomicum TaxID=46223 RepID=A0A1I3TT76_9BACL|nr:GNAT family N-acetyltransferase [Thermoflavimicrobium dichotomicum]SFJ73985.1 Ribosomal protein S18 acetylase RimI [Thermoflavimicrobium dichotomicum]
MVHIRLMREEDHSFILDLASRFLDFPQPAWRDQEKMLEAQKRLAREAISGKPAGSKLYVAEDQSGKLLGYLLIGEVSDFFTQEKKGFIYGLAVAKEAEGKGIGQMLMNYAEKWAKERGYDQVALSVFANNHRARSLYEKLGFEVETMSMVKSL